MRRLLHRVRSCTAGLGLAFALAPAPAFAEWFVDFYGGVALPQDDDVTIEEHAPFFTTPRTFTLDPNFDSSTTLGGRVGYWLPGNEWLGLALDISHFRAEGEDVDIDLVPFTPLVMLRWPLLVDDGFPHGRLQPYAGIGPGFFAYEMTAGGVRDNELDFEAEEAVGLDVRAGVAWQFSRSFALFGEYRFTHVELDVKEKGCLSVACFFSIFGNEGTRRSAEITLDTHHFLVGLSYRF